jgi:hypothetical protein
MRFFTRKNRKDYSKDTQLTNLLPSQGTNPKEQGVAQPCNLFTQSISLSNIQHGSKPMLALGRVEPDSKSPYDSESCSKINVRTCRHSSSSRSNGEVGGAEEDRTPDPLLAKQVLSQLSYSPIPWNPERVLKLWWAWVDSNYRPHPYQGCALTN